MCDAIVGSSGTNGPWDRGVGVGKKNDTPLWAFEVCVYGTWEVGRG